VRANPEEVALPASPDESAAGLIEGELDPLRYDGHVLDPDEVAGIVAGMVPKGARLLDVGCGTGSLAKLLADACGANVIGIEPDPSRARLASTRGLDVHIGYLSEALLPKTGLFDVVLFADVLEHLPSPQPVLALSRRFLSPCGCVVASVPNVAHWSVRLCLLRGKFEYQPWGIMDATHVRWFTTESIIAMFASAGLRVVEYRATAGKALLDNYGRAPLRWLPAKYRDRFLRVASEGWPTLFGAQHVIKAVMA
jgi:methionine biosynthesis protein MetW